jgi:prepilin signal peptidase PulO-like enzyme (type II secretory pathway)
MVYVILAILGLAFGSFINALVWRTHEKGKKKKKTLKNLSIVSGRSMCPNCKHTLSTQDLVPIFSWIVLRGKCRYCQKSISPQYPLVEALTAIIFVLSYVWWPSTIHGHQYALFTLWLLSLIGLIALLVYDLKWHLLPNHYIFPLYAVGLVYALINILSAGNHSKALLNEVLAVIVGGGIFYALFQISQGKWIGGGDVKLGYLLGLIAGTPGRSALLIFIASLLGSVFGILSILVLKNDRKSNIAFGPYLIIAAVIVQFFGHDILNWYKTTFFPSNF